MCRRNESMASLTEVNINFGSGFTTSRNSPISIRTIEFDGRKPFEVACPNKGVLFLLEVQGRHPIPI